VIRRKNDYITINQTAFDHIGDQMKQGMTLSEAINDELFMNGIDGVEPDLKKIVWEGVKG